MIAIAAADQNWAIGNKGELLVTIPDDMKNFRRLTRDGIVIFGRKTLSTFPNGKPLQNRINIILSRDPSFRCEGADVVHDIEELLELLAGKYDCFPKEKIFVIGGASIYRQLLPVCSSAIITRIEKAFEADAFFPDLDESEEWEKKETGDMQEYTGLRFHFDLYEKKEISCLI